MVGTINWLSRVAIAFVVSGCIMTLDEPELDPLVGTWKLTDDYSCGDSEMDIGERLEGTATLYYPYGVNCFRYEYQIVAESLGDDEYDIDFEWESTWNVTDDEDTSLEADDFDLDCSLDRDELNCDGDMDWEKD